ncbi:MAG TPA: SWIM zinc finger family protein [Bacillota bacterium]|nr:SWIM zinc finger family protein [Bacillota bacterium]
MVGNGANYRVHLWIKDGGVKGDCSCLYQGFCKHLVALALGWLNEKPQFINLQPELDQILQNPDLLPTLIKTLVAQDPVNFLELRFAEKATGKFEAARELSNLVRSIYTTPPLFPLDLDAFGERLNRIGQLLEDRITANDPEVLPPLNDLIITLTAQFGETKNPGFNTYFEKILSLAGSLPERYKPNQLRPILISLLKSYFEPGLWEQKTILGHILDRFEVVDPIFIQEYLEAKIKEQPDLFTLIGVYERLAPKMATKKDGVVDELYQQTLEALTTTSEGRLWLIDRLSETEPAQAFLLARNSLRQGMEPKASFRNRLITLHQKQNEPRQAASLSFIQFQEEPNFNEYLRLKGILSEDPQEFEGYLRRIEKFLKEQKCRSLLLLIAIDRHDYEQFQAQFTPIKDDLDSLLLIAELLTQNPSDAWRVVYPEIIRPLLGEPGPKFRQAVLQLIAAYKKACYQEDQKETWETFRRELLEEHGEDPWFQRKFGSILRE